MADTRLLFKNKLSLKSLKTVPTPSPPKPPSSLPTAPKPMAAPRPPSALRIKRMVATRAELTRRFPKCFPPIGSEPRPLKIGIKRDIIAAAPDLDRHDLINAIAAYCGDNAYHACDHRERLPHRPGRSRRRASERAAEKVCGEDIEGGAAMTDTTHTLHLSDADFNDLSDLLRRFGLNQIGRENFWREMNAQGWTQDTIDAWCTEYHETGQDRRPYSPETKGARHGA